jgi:hypothetical protein
MTQLDLNAVVGRSPEQLTLEQRFALTGKVVALEVYTPATLPLRRIEALADTVAGCIQVLKQRGLNPLKFEFVTLRPPY